MDGYEQSFPIIVDDPARLAIAYDAYINVLLQDLRALVGSTDRP